MIAFVSKWKGISRGEVYRSIYYLYYFPPVRTVSFSLLVPHLAHSPGGSSAAPLLSFPCGCGFYPCTPRRHASAHACASSTLLLPLFLPNRPLPLTIPPPFSPSSFPLYLVIHLEPFSLLMTFLFYLKIGLGESEAMWGVETVWLEMLAYDFSSCYSHCLCVLFMSMVTESICKWVECQLRFSRPCWR